MRQPGTDAERPDQLFQSPDGDQRLSRSRAARQDPVHAGNARRLSDRLLDPAARRGSDRAGAVLRAGRRDRQRRGTCGELCRDLLRRIVQPKHDLRPRHHAVHLGIDCHPARWLGIAQDQEAA
eukprot:TRINITY_DN12267_c0_g1_i4.p2 TRINITY_DN12267_c0_g1~~TRINITY_DN12267_c0_g1_i4.p2  ORF type:complete len:123 (-),score=6.97 TRINITY_DN12267_c0_g1_i4:275-643(-)